MLYAIVKQKKIVQECTYEDLDLALNSLAGRGTLHVFSRIDESEPWEYSYTVSQTAKPPRICA